MENQTELQEKFFEAVIQGSIDKVNECIEAGIDINTLTLKGNNALYVAAVRKRRDLFEHLLSIRQNGLRINLDNQNSFGNTTIFEFIKEGSMFHYLQRMIEEGANPNIPSASGITPLIQAVASNRAEEVEYLSKLSNIEINKVIPISGTTAFLMATSESRMKLTEILLENGADYDVIDSDGKNALLNVLSKNGRFLKRGEKIEHEKLCEFLIELGIDIDYQAPSGMTAFWMTSIMGNEKLSKRLIEKGVNVDVAHEYGLQPKESALHLWCKSNNLEMVKLIHENGGKFGVKDEIGNLPETFGFIAPNLQNYMLEVNADVNATMNQKVKDKILTIPVFSEVVGRGNENLSLIKEMINRGVNVTYPDTNKELKKHEPIYIAIAVSSPEILQELINTNKIDLNQQVNFIEKTEAISPLAFIVSDYDAANFATKKQQKKMLENLIIAQEKNEKNGILNPTVNKDSIGGIKEVLNELNQKIEVVLENKKIMFKALLEAGADINSKNEVGNTPLFFTNNKEYMQLMIENGGNVFHVNDKGEDLLYYSILNNRKETLPIIKEEYKNANHSTVSNFFYQLAFEDFSKSYLKQENVMRGISAYFNNPDVDKALDPKVPVEEKTLVFIKEVNYKDEDGNNPLIVAAANNTSFLVSALLTLGANINEQNNAGETALMHAISTENNTLIQFMLDKGADLNITNNAGENAFDIALKLNNEKITKTLYKALDKKDENTATKLKM